MRFLHDENGPATEIQFSCLKPGVGSTTILEEPPVLDEGKFPVSDIIAGPLTVSHYKGKKWEVPDYKAVQKYYDFVAKIDRKSIIDKINN